MAFLKVEAGKRHEALSTVQTVVEENRGLSAFLALAKAQVYVALEFAAAKTRDPYKQAERDDKVCAALIESAITAASGVTLYQSHLCAVRKL